MHRFYVPDLPDEGALIALPPDEARHLTQVLRLELGDEVRLFDGRGREHAARVEIAAKHRAELRVGAAAAAAPESDVRITLAAALLKGDKFDDVVRDAVMLGAAAIQPLITAHTEVPAARAGQVRRVDRWRRVALSSAKQAGRAVLPVVEEPRSFTDALESLPRPLLLLAEPSAGVLDRRIPGTPAEASVLVGPEGGWSAAELDTARAAGAIVVQLGGRTWRADAAPLVALAILMYEWDAL